MERVREQVEGHSMASGVDLMKTRRVIPVNHGYVTRRSFVRDRERERERKGGVRSLQEASIDPEVGSSDAKRMAAGSTDRQRVREIGEQHRSHSNCSHSMRQSLNPSEHCDVIS